MKDTLVYAVCVLAYGCVSSLPAIGREAMLQAGASQQAAKPSAALKLEDGTPVRLRLQRTISSADAQVDDRVDFDVLEEIKVGDLLVIPKGSVAVGTVTEAQPKRRMARGGKLNVNIDAVLDGWREGCSPSCQRREGWRAHRGDDGRNGCYRHRVFSRGPPLPVHAW